MQFDLTILAMGLSGYGGDERRGGRSRPGRRTLAAGSGSCDGVGLLWDGSWLAKRRGDRRPELRLGSGSRVVLQTEGVRMAREQ
jgi:hypothetical protein